MLAQAVQSYLSVRRAAGFALHGVEYHLKSFAAYSNAAWSVLRGGRDSHRMGSDRCRRSINGPGGWQTSLDLLGTCRRKTRVMRVPPAVFGSERRPRRPPYILSDEQIGRLITLAAQSGYSHPTTSDLQHTVRLALLYRDCVSPRPFACATTISPRTGL